MYKIIKNGAVMAMTEAPNYIKQTENGCLALCLKEEAQGVAHMGTPYNLLGCQPMEGVEDTVMLEEMDAGAMLAAIDRAAADTDALTVDQELRLTMLELGLADAGENI